MRILIVVVFLSGCAFFDKPVYGPASWDDQRGACCALPPVELVVPPEEFEIMSDREPWIG